MYAKLYKRSIDRPSITALLVCAGLLLTPEAPRAEPVAVRYAEGLVHGFLVLRTVSGQTLAAGELNQVARGERVTTQLVFRFQDGSHHEETVVFSQRRQFRLLSYHLVQKGPSFPHPMEVAIDSRSRRVTVRYQDDNGQEKVADERMDLPADLANGLIPILLKNVPSGAPPPTLSLVAATPKPQLVKLVITRAGEEPFAHGPFSHKASHFVLKVEIGGVKGLIAPLVGKQPPDSHVWILGGAAPAFVTSEAPFYAGGPSWRIELSSPMGPHAREAPAKR